MKYAIRRTMAALLAIALSLSTLPAPALAEVAEEAMGEELLGQTPAVSEPREKGEKGEAPICVEDQSAEGDVSKAAGPMELVEEGISDDEGGPSLKPGDSSPEFVVQDTGDESVFLTCELDGMGHGATTVSLGLAHSAIIKPDGSLWMWGNNSHGQLGDGSTTDSISPKKIMSDVKAVSLGEKCSAAIKYDGTLWTWGENDASQLGDGTLVDRASPVKVMSDVAFVSMGGAHAAAIKTDGSLWTWGSNYYGQLGNGSYASVEDGPVPNPPKKVMDGVSSVSVGSYHTAAVKSDGSLWTWGFNYYGQLGNGSDGDASPNPGPTKIMDGASAVFLEKCTLPR